MILCNTVMKNDRFANALEVSLMKIHIVSHEMKHDAEQVHRDTSEKQMKSQSSRLLESGDLQVYISLVQWLQLSKFIVVKQVPHQGERVSPFSRTLFSLALR